MRASAGPPVAFVYVSGLVQGVVMVSFAASSAVLCSRHGFTDTQYGSIFLPQVALSAIGAIACGALLRFLDLRHMLVLSFASMALSQAALAASDFLAPGPAFAAVMTGTSLMGLGGGLSAAPLNTYPQLFFPGKSDSAVVAMHTAMGVGLGMGPLLVALLVPYGQWLLFPLVCLLASLALLVATLRAPLPRSMPSSERDPARAGSRVPGRFWLFAGLALLYGVAEATFGNWGVLYLSGEKRLTVGEAGLALAAFWLALSGGRVVAGLVTLRFPAEPIYLGLPVLMAGAAFLLPYADGPGRAIFFFALAGLGCSAFYPLTVGLASRRFPERRAWVASTAYAALAAGLGAGSFLMGALAAHRPLSSLYRRSAFGPLIALLLAVLALTRPRPRGQAAG